jgi:hypothetical protein
VPTIQVRVMVALSVVLCAAPPAKRFMNIEQEAPVAKGEIETGQIPPEAYGSYLVTVTNPAANRYT